MAKNATIKQKSARTTRPHKLIKHAAPRVFKYSNLVRALYVKTSTPFISAVKHIDKKFKELDEPKNKLTSTKYVSVLGMGKNIDKCLRIGLLYRDERKRKIEILTKTVNVLDEFEFETAEDGDDLSDQETEYRKRAVSGVEIRIYRK